MLTVSAPGKLMLAGEWNILEPYASCIAVPTQRSMHATINPATSYTLSIPAISPEPIPLSYDNHHIFISHPSAQALHKKLSMVTTALSYALAYIHKHVPARPPFNIYLASNLSDEITQQKYGLGSSSATIVATIKAIITYYELHNNVALSIIFTLALCAHYSAQGNCGSGFDIAVATHNSPILYRNTIAHNLANIHISEETIDNVVNNLHTKIDTHSMNMPTNIAIIAGYSGISSHTPTLISAMNQYKKKSFLTYEYIRKNIEETVHEIAHAITHQNSKSFIACINKHQLIFSMLEYTSKIPLTIKPLQEMIDLALSCKAGAKVSGAGGGDCAIAVCDNASMQTCVEQKWRQGNFPIIERIYS